MTPAAYDALTPEFDSKDLEELLDSWRNSQLVQDGLQFVNEKYEEEMKDATQKSTIALMKEAIALVESRKPQILDKSPAEQVWESIAKVPLVFLLVC